MQRKWEGGKEGRKDERKAGRKKGHKIGRSEGRKEERKEEKKEGGETNCLGPNVGDQSVRIMLKNVYFMFEFPCIISLYYIKNQHDATLAVLFISHCKIALHVSDAFRVHHQEY